MSVTKLNLDIDTDYFLETTYLDYTTNTPINTNGYSAILQVRENWLSKIPYLTLTTENGRILMTGVNGGLIARFAPEDLRPDITPTFWIKGVYDLILTDRNGIRIKLMEGYLNIVSSVSLDYKPIIYREYMVSNLIQTSVGSIRRI
jgi:hypothetical protein